jgi:hypothetical protein
MEPFLRSNLGQKRVNFSSIRYKVESLFPLYNRVREIILLATRLAQTYVQAVA